MFQLELILRTQKPNPAEPSVLQQGSKIGEGVVVDSLDVMDPTFLEIGDDVVLGEHATLLAHTFKDGYITFNKVSSASVVVA